MGQEIEETRFTAVANLAARHYIVRSYDDPTPRRIDLATIDLASKLPRQVDLPAAGFLDLTV